MLTIPIIFENTSLLVLDKPCGLTVNRSETTKGQETLQDWLEQKFSIFPDPLIGIPTPQGGRDNFQFSNDKESDFYKRSGIVHRLDKDTSGLIIVAKTPQAFTSLQKQFKERLISKTYLALVWGKLTGSGEVNAPITRNPYNRLRFGVFVGGKEAHTKYRVIKNSQAENQNVTLLEVNPITGRTHQIRVHLNYLGFPVVGDPLYSGDKLSKLGQALFGRLMLHAYKISFLDPENSQRIELKSEIPKVFQKHKQ